MRSHSSWVVITRDANPTPPPFAKSILAVNKQMLIIVQSIVIIDSMILCNDFVSNNITLLH